jgi:hypothetical protein
MREAELGGERVPAGGAGCANLAAGHRLVVRADPVQDPASPDGNVRSPIAWGHTGHKKPSCRIAFARDRYWFDGKWLVDAVSRSLDDLLLDELQHLLVERRRPLCCGLQSDRRPGVPATAAPAAQ